MSSTALVLTTPLQQIGKGLQIHSSLPKFEKIFFSLCSKKNWYNPPKTGKKAGIDPRTGGGQNPEHPKPAPASSNRLVSGLPPSTDPVRVWAPPTPDGYNPKTGKKAGIDPRTGGGQTPEHPKPTPAPSNRLGGALPPSTDPVRV